jgi:hypothetical protein
MVAGSDLDLRILGRRSVQEASILTAEVPVEECAQVVAHDPVTAGAVDRLAQG